MRVYVIARDIQRYDAVGNFCRQIERLLTQRGFEAQLVAENCHPDDRTSTATVAQMISVLADDDVLMFHFSTADPSFAVVAACRNAKIVYFHNITPAHFFAGIDARTADLVRAGLKQRPLAARFDVLMANSRASAGVLYDGFAQVDRERLDKASIVTCPPVIGIDRWADIADQPTSNLDGKFVLYVGRLVPHKNVALLIAGFAVLARRDPKVRLVCVGGPPDSPYLSTLKAQIAELLSVIGDRIEIQHDIPDGVLKSLYRDAAVCATMSAHEGFGVPLVDALIFDKPLVISNEAGMVETAGDAAIVVSDLAPDNIARALEAAMNDDATRTHLGSARRARLEEIRRATDGHLVLDAVTNAGKLQRARSL